MSDTIDAETGSEEWICMYVWIQSQITTCATSMHGWEVWIRGRVQLKC